MRDIGQIEEYFVVDKNIFSNPEDISVRWYGEFRNDNYNR